jgi:hypothetical protein
LGPRSTIVPICCPSVWGSEGAAMQLFVAKTLEKPVKIPSEITLLLIKFLIYL